METLTIETPGRGRTYLVATLTDGTRKTIAAYTTEKAAAVLRSRLQEPRSAIDREVAVEHGLLPALVIGEV